MLVLEQRDEREEQHQRVRREDQPHRLPVGNAVGGVHLNHFTAYHAAQNTAEAVGHHQEHTLCAGADFRLHLFFHKHRTRDVEEVEGAAVNDHRQHQQHGAERAWVAVGEQAEAQHPCRDTDQHDVFDAVAAQEERDGQDEQRLRDLRDGHHHRRVFNDKAAGEQRVVIEAVQEGVAEHVGDLQLCAQQHGEDKEDRHAFVFKQRERVQAEHGAPALVFLLVRNRNGWQRQGEDRQQHRERCADIELHMAQFEAREAHAPHRHDKADSSPDTDWREIGHDIHIRGLQAVVGDGVDQAKRWHIGQRVKQDHHEHRPRRGHLGCHKQRPRAHQMAKHVQPFRTQPFIRHDAQQRWHEDSRNTERAVNGTD